MSGGCVTISRLDILSHSATSLLRQMNVGACLESPRSRWCKGTSWGGGCQGECRRRAPSVTRVVNSTSDDELHSKLGTQPLARAFLCYLSLGAAATAQLKLHPHEPSRYVSSVHSSWPADGLVDVGVTVVQVHLCNVLECHHICNSGRCLHGP